MEFNMDMKSGNSAFADGGRDEVAEILRELADKISMGVEEGACFDSNGGNVGAWSFTPSEDEEDDDTPKKILDSDGLRDFAANKGFDVREPDFFEAFVEALEEQFSFYPVFDDNLNVEDAEERANEIMAENKEV